MSTPHAKIYTTTPLFVVADMPRSLDFYSRLGFTEHSLWGEPTCFAMVRCGGFEIMLSLAESPDRVRPNGPGGIWDMYIRLADIAAEIAALESAGIKLDRGPTDAFYQMREIEVLDPDGYRICVAQDVS
ncbi:MAG TPA: VOC family protein [Pirellulaceae bacterium]|nr:VOC family protein [Pirellulaceae bacterium]